MVFFVSSSAWLDNCFLNLRRKQIQVGVSFILILAVFMMTTTLGINQYLVQNFILTGRQQQHSTVNYSNENDDTDLYRIMSNQYDVQYGKFEGVPFKKILYWNTFPSLHNYEEYGMGIGRDGYRQAGCPVWQCETSNNRTDLLNYDAILFHYRLWNDSDVPQTRSPDQRYIFFMKESPDWPWPEDSSYFRVRGT